MAVRGTTHISLILQSTNAQRHTHRVMWCNTIRPNGNVFYECPLLWMCESDWEADKLQHPAKCQSHGGHKWLWAHCYNTLGTLSLCLAIHNRPRRSAVEQIFDSDRIFGLQTDCILENRITFYHYNFISWQTVGRCLLSQPLPSCSECLSLST